MLRTRPRLSPPPLPPGLEVYRPPEVIGSSVLIVEDEIPMQSQLRLDLTDLGYQAKVAGSANEAQQLLTRERVAGVLLDLVLDEGEEGGFELLRWIRQNHPGLPVIVLSAAQVSSVAIRRAYELGASSYFVQGNVPLVRLDSDPTHRTMSLGQQEIRLTSQKTALVVHLAQGSKAATAGDLIAAGLFRPNAARSTVHSALLTLRRTLDELEPDLGSKLLHSTAKGYSLGPIV